MTYTIKCCGPAKEYFPSEDMQLKSDKSLTAASLKNLLLKHLKKEVDTNEASDLLDACMIATDEKVVDDKEVLSKKAMLFLLPPVCGG